MISDALLREAAAEAEVCLLANLPEVQPHEFSAGFERKMKRLISRANHPIRHQVLRYAAAVLLAVLTLFGAVLAVSPEARAAVFGWVKNTFYAFVEYSSSGTGNGAKYSYHLTKIPDGYKLLKIDNSESEMLYLYADESGGIFQFSYISGENASKTLFITKEHQHYTGTVRGFAADIYIANNQNETSTIIWIDKDEDILFYICAKANMEELIVLAESVQRKSE